MARFLVANVFQIVGRGRGVAAKIVEGSVAIGTILRQERGAAHLEWRVIGIESVYSPNQESDVGLFFWRTRKS